MDFTKDIYLNKEKVYENSELIILYKGNLCRNNSDKLFLSYGYGNLWENKNEIELKRTDFGYLGNINIQSGTNFQFCIHDSNNNWDNNNYKNYIVPIYDKEEENIFSFNPIKESEKEIDIEVLKDTNLIDSQTSAFTPITISSETIDIYSNKKLENINKSVIPENTIITGVEFDKGFLKKSFEKQIISRETEKTIIKEYKTPFSTLTQKAKENSVKAFDDNHITAGSVYVNSLIEEYNPKISEPPTFIEDITINSLVPKSKSEIAHKNLSKIYLLKKKIKLSLFKFIKLVKTALNYNEDKI